MYLFDRKRLAEFLRSGLPDRFLHMEIMLGHINIRMAHNALNRGQIHSQRLHLADVCVSAGMRRQHPNIGDTLQICLEGVAEIRWIAGLIYLPHLPDKPAGGIANLLIKSSTNFRDSNVQKLGITREPSLRRLSLNESIYYAGICSVDSSEFRCSITRA